MATRYGTQKQTIGMTLESVQGTAEAAPAIWLRTRGFAKLDAKLMQLQDSSIGAFFGKMPPAPGQISVEGTVGLNLDAQTMGEWLKSLLGQPTSTQQGGTIAYKHSFVRSSSVTPVNYTFFKDYGLTVLKYNMGVVKKTTIKAALNAVATVDHDVLAQNEVAGSIGSPSFVAPQLVLPHQLTCKINTVVTNDITDVSLSIDNMAKPDWTLNASQLCEGIYANEAPQISGTFSMLFSSGTERAAFLANTSRKLEFIFTGAQIASPYNYQVAFTIFDARYKAFPYGDEHGFLGAKVQLDGYYSTADGKDIQIDLINTKTSY